MCSAPSDSIAFLVDGLTIVFERTTALPLPLIDSETAVSRSDQVADSPFFVGPSKRALSYSSMTEPITRAFTLPAPVPVAAFPFTKIGRPSLVLTKMFA